MREKVKKWPEIGVVLFCLFVLGLFVLRKEGFHMDELLSFELANAEFNPWIVPTQPEGRLAKFVRNEIDGESFGETFRNLAAEAKDVLQNRGESKLLTYTADVYEEPVWITAEQFQDYITVDRGDAFNYLSVYFNVKDDNHPPLHFMLLHTVCSLFQGRAESWMGCLINLAAVAAVMVLLIKSGRLLADALGMKERTRLTGLLAALLYGLSTGAVATALLIRMYGMLTLWCAAYFYIVLKKWLNREFDRHNVCLTAVTAMGFWTQYFFLFYCILLAGVVCVLLVRSGRRRELGGFIRSMAIAAAVGLAVFPFAVSDVFSSGRGVEALGNLAAGLGGYGGRLITFFEIVEERSLGWLFWGMLLLMAIGRRMPFGKVSFGNKTGRECLWMLLFPAAGYYLLAARMSPYLVDRYVMPVFPFVALTGALAAAALLEGSGKRWGAAQGRRLQAVVCLAAVLIQGYGLTRYDGSYLYSGYALQEAIAENNADYPCICIYDGVGYYENLKEFTYYKKTLLLTFDELTVRQDTASIESLERVALLVKAGASYDMEDVMDVMEHKYGFTVEKLGMREKGVHGDLIYFLKKDGGTTP